MSLNNGGDLRSLSKSFQVANWPETACPSCYRGALSLADSKSLQTVESLSSRANRDHEGWEPEWLHGTFHAELTCDRSQCGQVVIVSGDWETMTEKLDSEGWDGQSYEEVVLPRFFLPSLVLIQPNEKYPNSVRELVASASTILWTDPSSAANRLRTAIEELLTLQRVRKTTTAGKRMTTHARIVEFEKKRPEPAKFLMSVKWIGNTGSHEDSLTAPDVVDAADLLDHALALIYDTRPQQLAKKADAINKRKGLPRKKK
ncbi:DUF4145 domain-containing protein [Kitasatospora sp. NPDC088346]|uniref:DUF4145 domain-containing protein n=1 Tax=Kitasatospora sp. NPDC088346 TaxID=3364073 RepID=UPI0038289058